MKIESIIRRASGSTVKLGEQTYRFTPGEDGRHVCEVEDEAHIDRLLSITNGFRAVEEEEQAPSRPPVVEPPPPEPVGAEPGLVPEPTPVVPEPPKPAAKPASKSKAKAPAKAK